MPAAAAVLCPENPERGAICARGGDDAILEALVAAGAVTMAAEKPPERSPDPVGCSAAFDLLGRFTVPVQGAAKAAGAGAGELAVRAIENPIENPIQNPIENPIENPVENPIENPIELAVRAIAAPKGLTDAEQILDYCALYFLANGVDVEPATILAALRRLGGGCRAQAEAARTLASMCCGREAQAAALFAAGFMRAYAEAIALHQGDADMQWSAYSTIARLSASLPEQTNAATGAAGCVECCAAALGCGALLSSAVAP